MDPTPPVYCRYGAPMGRATRYPDTEEATLPTKVSLRRIHLDGDGYDKGGAYWGLGPPLYWAGSENGAVGMFFRASNRDKAKAHVRETFPHAKFYR